MRSVMVAIFISLYDNPFSPCRSIRPM